jgi:hypothetical protein
MTTRKRKTDIRDTLNKLKVKCIKVLRESITGSQHTAEQIQASTNTLILLQHYRDE